MVNNILDFLRYVLYGALVILSFVLYQAWMHDHEIAAQKAVHAPQETVNPITHVLPEQTAANPESIAPSAAAVNQSQIVHVHTDLLDLSIDTRGGDIIEAKLLHYPQELGNKEPVVLLNNDPKNRYLAESGLLSAMGPDTSNQQALYSTQDTDFQLRNDENELQVPLFWQNDKGLIVRKIFILKRDSYEIKVRYEINNQTTATWEGNLYAQLLRTNTPPPSQGGIINLATYFGAAISTPQKPFDKIAFKNMDAQNLNTQAQSGWIAMIQHYFISAFVPPEGVVHYYTKKLANNLYAIGLMGPKLSAAPNQEISTETKLYVGPSIADRLEKTAPNLKLTIDYGWFWFISGIIFLVDAKNL